MLSLSSFFSFLWLLSKMVPGFGHGGRLSPPGAGNEDGRWLRDSSLVGSEEHLLSALRDWVPLLSLLVPWPPRWSCESHTVTGPGGLHLNPPQPQPCLTSSAVSTQSTQDFADAFTKATEDLRPQASLCLSNLVDSEKAASEQALAGANPGFEIQMILRVFFKEDKKERWERDAIL